MSPRTFARRFRAETGTTPHSWVTKQRVQAAEELLERTDHSIDWIAGEVGFGNAATLRHHFARVRGISPVQYRRRFAG
jgi:transcriptional regulator GlxA family with amidase domain